MANRMFNQFQGSLEKGVVQLYAEASFTGGVPTLVNGKGIASLSISSGVLTVTLQDSYVKILSVSAMVKRFDSTAPNVAFVTLRSDSVTNATTPAFSLRLSDITYSAVSPADGVFIVLSIALSNSTAL